MDEYRQLQILRCILWRGLTFSPEAPVRTKVENTGSWYLVLIGQLSMVPPIGRQNTGTDSGSGNDSRSSSG
jgi:hypothetical protein